MEGDLYLQLLREGEKELICPYAYEDCRLTENREIFYVGTSVAGPCINQKENVCPASLIKDVFYTSMENLMLD